LLATACLIAATGVLSEKRLERAAINQLVKNLAFPPHQEGRQHLGRSM
jgi:hypothetical protein